LLKKTQWGGNKDQHPGSESRLGEKKNKRTQGKDLKRRKKRNTIRGFEEGKEVVFQVGGFQTGPGSPKCIAKGERSVLGLKPCPKQAGRGGLEQK